MLLRDLPVVGLCLGVRGDIAGDDRSNRTRRRRVNFDLRRFTDLSITAASVVTSLTSFKQATAGAAITAGQALYQHTDNTLKLAQADGTAAEAAFVGIALNNAASGQPVLYLPLGDITIGATVAVGTWYAVSATAGGIAPVADLSSGNYGTIIGYGKTASVLSINPVVSGVAKA